MIEGIATGGAGATWPLLLAGRDGASEFPVATLSLTDEEGRSEYSDPLLRRSDLDGREGPEAGVGAEIFAVVIRDEPTLGVVGRDLLICRGRVVDPAIAVDPDD